VSSAAAVAYIDSSALVKLVVPEAESAALRAELAGWERHMASALVRTELVRACTRVSAAAGDIAERVVTALDLVAVDDLILRDAARLRPAALRTLDAIHLASAQALGASLGTLVAYDARLLDAANALGLPTITPA
jgi:uncharacterized protein